MNVLFVIHTPRDERTAVYGGCLERKKYFENQGHPTEIWTPDDFGGVKSLGRLIPLFYPFFVAVRLLGRGHRGRHDAVLFHSYCGWAYFLLSKFYARTDRANAAVMFHGLEPLYYRALKEETARRGRRLSWRMRFFYGFLFVHMIRFSTRHAGKTFCLNREERDYLTGRGYVGENRCRQLANSVPEIFFAAREYAETARTLLFAGHWLETKGTCYLTRAFEKLAGEFPELSLRIIGTGVSEVRVRGDFPEALDRRLRVITHVDAGRMVDEYRNADVFVFPSLSEGFSQALLEAMAAGMPVVATEAGAAPDLLENGKNSLTVKMADADALAAAVRRLLCDRALRQRLGESAQKTARRYLPDRVLREWLDACLEVCASREEQTA